MQFPGTGMSGYGFPANYEKKVQRIGTGTTGNVASRTPLEQLNGMITPNGLHFERHHSGVPDIDPPAHSRSRQAALRIHDGFALALSNGVAYPVHRVFGQ
jgi:hypothetical protein